MNQFREAVEHRDERLLKELVNFECEPEVWEMLSQLFNENNGQIIREIVNDVVVYFDNQTIHFEVKEDWKNFGVSSNDIKVRLQFS